MSARLGYILAAPGRPGEEQQRKVLQILGVDTGAASTTLWSDRIDRGSTRPRGQLLGREAMIEVARVGDTVVFADPLCVALSRKDADWCLGTLSARGVRVIVCGDLECIEPGEDMSGMIRRVGTANSAHHVRVSRQRSREAR